MTLQGRAMTQCGTRMTWLVPHCRLHAPCTLLPGVLLACCGTSPLPRNALNGLAWQEGMYCLGNASLLAGYRQATVQSGTLWQGREGKGAL